MWASILTGMGLRPGFEDGLHRFVSGHGLYELRACGDPVLSNRVFYVCTVIVGALNVGIAFYEVGF